MLCGAFPFVAQLAAQRFTSPEHTALILSLEPVFGAVFSMIILSETMSLPGHLWRRARARERARHKPEKIDVLKAKSCIDPVIDTAFLRSFFPAAQSQNHKDQPHTGESRTQPCQRQHDEAQPHRNKCTVVIHVQHTPFSSPQALFFAPGDPAKQKEADTHSGKLIKPADKRHQKKDGA